MAKQIAVAIVLVLIVAVVRMGAVSMAPLPPGPPERIVVQKAVSIGEVLNRLQANGVIRSATWTRLAMRLQRSPKIVGAGTYSVRPGMNAAELTRALQSPLLELVTIPEGRWIRQSAEILAKHGLPSEEYVKAAGDTRAGMLALGLKIPGSTLEGYLFPDSYHWPAGTSAQAIVASQLKAFRGKAMPLLQGQTNPHRTVVIASLVELEAKKPSERARIAGVIENRLHKGMRLELDCTVLYGIQEWRQLRPGEVQRLDSPYNTYRHDGLPPGPVCSPGLASLRAASKPERHGYLFYVARPDGSHYFADTYPHHLANIRKARAEVR
ncbi:MAG: endolytic transglycosylase MltG [Fimbriimonadaceae bacterium]|nr:endolytic transglycosylase MltG [Fimbriimonadaceae bacterium]